MGEINPKVTSICFQKNSFPCLTAMWKQAKGNVSLVTFLHSQPASFHLLFSVEEDELDGQGREWWDTLKKKTH